MNYHSRLTVMTIFKTITMRNDCRYLLILLVLTGCLAAAPGTKAQQLLWQIGRPDNNMAEFALAPGKEGLFRKDGLFIVGRSDTKKDWPYAHPGPNDAWAGNRPHRFSILFGLKAVPEGDSCTLDLQLLDVGPARVELNIQVNEASYHTTLQRGAARAIYGDIAAGRKTTCRLRFPVAVLHKGTNVLSLTSQKGSWFLYDWVALHTPGTARLAAVQPGLHVDSCTALPFLVSRDNRDYQVANIALFNTGDSTSVQVQLGDMAVQTKGVGSGNQQVEVYTPSVSRDSVAELIITRNKTVIARQRLQLHPVKKMTIYILPHSHNDIGYTEIQTAVEKKQINNLLKGIDYARRTKNYPAGARFVWNLEGTYAANLFLERMGEQQKQDFYEAVKDGGVALNGMYLNTLTGLCRPAELLRLFKYATELGEKTHTQVDAAMISDVPGYTWGTVTAMAQAGIKYFSAAPNYFDRIGDILVQWEDKPFYWGSPSGKEKVLVWIPYKGYALSHGMPGGLTAQFAADYLNRLQQIQYPYDITYIRWSGHGDNAVPDMSISDFVKDFSSRYSWPRFIISSTSTAFSAFEKKYSNAIPYVKGDWTGYWEDGAASSALETAENRNSSSRLTQAEALWAMVNPGRFPAEEFKKAWRHVLLYSEHTWGADVSVTRPLSQKTMEQWQIKKSYADTAGELSASLLAAATGYTAGVTQDQATANTIQVFNTSSWPRTELVLVKHGLSAAGDKVTDDKGNTLPSQRLSTGELAFIAGDVPPFAAKRYTISAGVAPASKAITANGALLDNGIVSVQLDTRTGAIQSMRHHAIDNNFADSASGEHLNDYLFLEGNDTAKLQRNGPVHITVKEQGPVLATLQVESSAPGCDKLTREITLVKDADYAAITNMLDKRPAPLNPNPGDYAWANTGGKESVNFGFPFHVTNGTMQLDIPMAVMQPEKDQIPGSCKNWLEVGSWADVSNNNMGITWVTLDAPLVEVGGITATLLGGQTNPAVWRKKIEPTQKLYSWAINNHWETNYRAYQDGIIRFRYALRPHRLFDAAAANRFATALTQPLVVSPATGTDYNRPLLQLGSDKIQVLVLKPSEDGKAWIVTLFNPTAETQSAALQWSVPVVKTNYSNTAEQALAPVNGAIQVAARDVVTLRVER